MRLDKILCFFISVFGSKEERYLGRNTDGHYLFIVEKHLFGFPLTTNKTIKYERVIDSRWGKLGISEIKEEVVSDES